MRSMSPCLAWKKRPPGFASLRLLLLVLLLYLADEFSLPVRSGGTKKIIQWEEKSNVLGYSYCRH
jgi:hypothetical protein